MEYINFLGALFLLGGSLSLLISSIGLLRMPDVYNRVQVGTKASTFGSIVTFIGIALMKYEFWFTSDNWLGRIIILIVFILMSNPVSSHVLMRAAYFNKIPLSDKTCVDQLKVDLENNITKSPKVEVIKPNSIENMNSTENLNVTKKTFNQ
jgi:multicomponent Na+:H+ antiporter subunit G